VLVPAAKVRLTRLGVELASFAVEIHGGNGYCEDWFLTRQLRDAQCHPIWEGTEEICQLDVLRAIRREAAHEAVLARIEEALATAASGATAQLQAPVVRALRAARDEVATRVSGLPAIDGERAEAAAARITALLTITTSAALLAERGASDVRGALVAAQYAHRNLGVGDPFDDGIALLTGRELLAHADIAEELATEALPA
jgi:acyl-CoA dehydrogenase